MTYITFALLETIWLRTGYGSTHLQIWQRNMGSTHNREFLHYQVIIVFSTVILFYWVISFSAFQAH